LSEFTALLHCSSRVVLMWGKRRDMTVRDRLPFNAEPPASVLAGKELTELEAFYCRNHGPFPDITREQWRLTVDGMVQKPLTLTYDRLTSQFTPHSVVATLACAGNRRAELLRVRPIPGKDPWAHGAISTAEWRGVRLADVLGAAGVDLDEGLHVAFSAPDVAQEASPVQSYGSSIPLSKAMSEEVLLAWEMNSEPLPRSTVARCGWSCRATSGPAASSGSQPSLCRQSRRQTTSRQATIASFRPTPTPTPCRPAKAFRCRRLR
jgi:sulfite oxidase